MKHYGRLFIRDNSIKHALIGTLEFSKDINIVEKDADPFILVNIILDPFNKVDYTLRSGDVFYNIEITENNKIQFKESFDKKVDILVVN